MKELVKETPVVLWFAWKETYQSWLELWAKTRAHLCGLVSRTILLGSRPTWKNKLPSINSSRASSEIKASFTKITECKGLFSFVS